MLKKSMQNLRIAICQINPTVGDVRGNRDKILSYIQKAKEKWANLAIFPEFSLTGAPFGDLIFFERFQDEVDRALEDIKVNSYGLITVIGSIYREGSRFFDAALLFSEGKLSGVYKKRVLRRREMLDEKRYFLPGDRRFDLEFSQVKIELLFGSELDEVPLGEENDLYIVLDSSVYFTHKVEYERNRIFGKFGEKIAIYCNLVGGEDEWVFYGGSFVTKGGGILKLGSLFEEDLIIWDFFQREAERIGIQPEKEKILSALILATGDYVRKNGFKRVFLGLSGGLDSCVTAYISSKAVGEKNVSLLFMPTRFTSKESYEDAESLSKNLNVELINIPIDEFYGIFASFFERYMGYVREITLENIQPRIRASILMAFANNFDGVVLATGNKSEIATGYFTIYGDGAGGYAPLRDIPKTLVYELANHINSKEGFSLIPERVLKKEPSAELRFGQKDSDSLPPYVVLDKIVSERIEGLRRKGERTEFSEETLNLTLNRFLLNEFKRRQIPIGPIIFEDSLFRNIRLPVTNRWRY